MRKLPFRKPRIHDDPSQLDKHYPHAHLRRIPENNIKPQDDAIDPAELAKALEKAKRGSRAMSDAGGKGRPISAAPSRPISRPVSGYVSDDPVVSRRPSAPKRHTSSSRFSVRLREAARDDGRMTPSPYDVHSRSAPGSRRNTISKPWDSRSSAFPAHHIATETPNRKGAGPPNDPHRRALRAWLRDTLSVRTVGHNKEAALFLLLGGVTPKDLDLRDMMKRIAVDEGRRQSRIEVAQGAADRARTVHMMWTSVQEEMVNGGKSLALCACS